MNSTATSPPIETVLSCLPDAQLDGDGWKARCPAHDDHTPSLGINIGEDGRVLLNCWVGCSTESIVRAMGLTMRDLFVATTARHQRPNTPPPKPKAKPIFATAEDAVTAYCGSLGKPVAAWSYHDRADKFVGAVVRWNMSDGKKEYRPVSLNGSGWLQQGMSEPRPLYGLPNVIAATGRIYVLEGEKAVDAARRIGLTATTSPHGSQSAAKADWSVMDGKPEIVCVPDNDAAGEQYISDIIGIVSCLTSPPKIKILRLAGLPPGGDIADWLDQRDAIEPDALRDEIEALADAADVVATPTNGSIPPKSPRTPLAAGTKVRCSDRGNLGDVVYDDGGPTITVAHVGKDGTKTVDHPATEVRLADGSAVVPTTIEPPPMLSVRELVATNRKLREPIIDGLLREGETMNIIAATKIGKSWLATLLALDFATRRKWLGRFDTAGGDVLIVDNELHAETSAYRIPAVATANMTHLDEYADHVFVMNLRGGLVSLPELAVVLSTIAPGKFRLIILDAFYRFLPPGTDENDNGAMAALYNLLDQIAGKVQCAIVCIHHSSKGSQAGKSVTDVGSGAGSMSRAADCHVVLRPHETENVVVMEAAARSWPPLKPLCLRWEWPLFSEDTTLDPTLLKPERPKATEKERSARLAADCERLMDLLKKATEPLTKNEISVRLGLNDKNFKAAFAEILGRNVLTQSTKKAGNGQSYDAYFWHSDTPTLE
ncbi:MAG: AAA family ATPase [Planctomycetaceae bacterium]